nr:hypothetical protein [Tanacetum cinerariifolium]
MYVEYHKEFWYSAEVEEETKTSPSYFHGVNYINNDLTFVKPHTIIAASFQKPLASEVPLTSYMLKLAKLFEEPEQSLIPPSKEVNADVTTNKSLSRASMQLVTQPKAPTNLNTKKKRILPSSKQILHIRPGSSFQRNKSLRLSTLKSQWPPLTSPRVQDQNVDEEVKDAGFVAMEEVTFEQIMDEVDSKTQDAEEGDASESLVGLRSMPDDDLSFISGFESQESDDHVSEEDYKTLNTSADKPALSDPIGQLHADLGILNTKIDQLEISISKKVAEDMKSSIPVIVADTLKEHLPGPLSDALKDTLPQLVKDSIKSSILESILEELPQAQKWTEHEVKKVKIMEEYNNLISFRVDKLPITKISYVVNTNKEATMKRTRGDNPLNLIVHPNFRLKRLDFSEWLEVHASASKKYKKLNDMLLQSLRAKFQWAIDQAKTLGLPPPPAIATFGMTDEEKKRKRTEILKEVFVTENITVDRMQRNLIPSPGVVPIEGLVINEPESGIFFMNGNTDIAFQRESEFHLTPTIQLIRIQKQIKLTQRLLMRCSER